MLELWRVFLEALYNARANARQRRLERATPWRPDQHRDRLERLLSKEQNRPLDSEHPASE